MFSTTPLQQHLLQHRFSTAFATLSFVAALQHRLRSTIFCSIAFAFEWR
jgi:hypothetical protein